MFKKALLALLAGALLYAPTRAAHAVSFTITTTGGNWVTSGITSDNGRFTNTLIPFISGVGATSAVSFGVTLTSENGSRPASDTFTGASVSFEFDVLENDSGISHHYVVDGTFVGLSGSPVARMTVNSAGFGESKAAFQAEKVTVDGSLVFTSVVNSPLLIPSIQTDVMFGSLPVTLWVDRRDQLTPPGDFATLLSVGGFIQAGQAVPEPGSLAMLLGTGVGGSLLLIRRRARR